MSYSKAHEAYQHDPFYRQAVDCMMNMIVQLHASPSEVREMATFACILFEETNARPKYIMDKLERKEG
jgi:hypothetical protein